MTRHEYQRAYYDEHRQRILARKRIEGAAYYAAHKDKVLARQKRLYQKNRAAMYRVAARAKNRGLSWELTRAEYEELRSRPCFYCGGDLPPAGVGLDRKDSNEGYILSNVLPCCGPCNALRQDLLTIEETKKLVALLKQIRGGGPWNGRHDHSWRKNADPLVLQESDPNLSISYAD